MATRPWVTPQEVKEYTDYPSVADRADNKLAVDISRAEQKVISLTNNKFEGKALPPSVRTAVILIAEYYAYHASEKERKLKSRTFDDYAETFAEAAGPSWEGLDLDSLLADDTNIKPKGNVTMHIHSL